MFLISAALNSGHEFLIRKISRRDQSSKLNPALRNPTQKTRRGRRRRAERVECTLADRSDAPEYIYEFCMARGKFD